MPTPDYLICLECDTPNYTFEWRNDKLHDVICEKCGNDDVDTFASPEEVETLDSTWDRKTGRGHRSGRP